MNKLVACRTAVEAHLAEFSNRSCCRVTSRGATAIYLALKLIGQSKGYGNVIVPAIGCLSIPQSVKLAGHTPVFADVDPHTGCISVKHTASLANDETKAILPIHIFGHAAEISEICQLASSLGASVIEDACHSLGGVADGRRIGSWGQFSVASFGGTKSLGGLGGGALFFDDSSLSPLIEELVAEVPFWPAKSVVELLALSHRNLYHAATDYRRATGGQDQALTLGGTSEQYGRLLVASDAVSSEALEAIKVGIVNAKENNEKRLYAANFYDRALDSTPCYRLPIGALEQTGTLWRYTFTCPNPESTQSLTASLRKAGLHASNQFWSLAEIWEGNNRLAGAGWFQERVVNLWVDHSVTQNYLERTREVIAEWNTAIRRA
jgi:dTDP-4-amino-4,6-dideoxygalactose transaminase